MKNQFDVVFYYKRSVKNVHLVMGDFNAILNINENQGGIQYV